MKTFGAIVQNWKTLLDNEISLDPSDWDKERSIGKTLIDQSVDLLETIAEKKVWNQPTDDFKNFVTAKWENDAIPADVLFHQYKEYIQQFPKGNIHPRFWSWVQGTGSITAAYADFLGSVLNSNVTIGDHSAMYIEQQVIGWLLELMGYDTKEGSGILLSGGSMANITGIMVARNAHDPDIRKNGIQSITKPLVFYASSETHSCQIKAAEVMGLGSDALRKITVNDQYQLDIDQLENKIISDIQNGFDPFCVVANVGTVNTGAIDPLKEIYTLCKKYNLWMHVDGAFGALVKLLPEYSDVIEYISKADSIAFDLHKWMYLPYECGCLLVKDKSLHRSAFALQPNYLSSHERGLAAGPDPIGNYGMELSRGFKALKVWFCFQEHGRKKYETLIRQNIAQCLYLADLIENHPFLELMAPVPMNIVCFRYTREGLSLEESNKINKEILMQLHEKGIAAPSYTILNGHYVLRVANVNHRSKKSDFDALVKGVVDIGENL